MTMKVSEILERLREDNWEIKSQKGSHRQFVHPTKSGKVTLNGKPSDDINKWLLRSIFRQASWPWPPRH